MTGLGCDVSAQPDGGLSLAFLVHSFLSPQKVIIVSPVLRKTKMVQSFGLFIDYDDHILLQCQVDSHVQGPWLDLP